MRWLAILAVLLGLLFAGAARAVDDVVSTLTDRYADASLLILGEYHGTEESPAVLLGLTRHWLRDGPVTIALELWRSEQERIDTYLASPGTEADRQTLLRGAFWQREPRDSDGRLPDLRSDHRPARQLLAPRPNAHPERLSRSRPRSTEGQSRA